MKRVFHLWPCVLAVYGLLASTGAAVTAAPMADELKVGDPAPDFSLPGSDGKTYALAQLKGKHIVLAWFPMAFTGG
jgi:peroxiredoxin Q/BCP